MCNNYPNCFHAGPIVPEQLGMLQHCKTPYSNDSCPYLSFCGGCTFTSAAPAKNYTNGIDTIVITFKRRSDTNER